MKDIKKYIESFIDFIRHDVWRVSLDNKPKSHSFLIRQLRIILLTIRGFDEDGCSLKASALTFYSLLSVVPVAAMIFGVAKGFGMENRLEQLIREKFSGIGGLATHGDESINVVDKVIVFAKSMLDSTQGGLIAGIGLLVLFWSVMKVLSNIEVSFNDIWQIKNSRPWVRKFTDYFSLMLVAPVLIIISASLNVYVTAQVKTITEQIALLGYFSPLIYTALKVTPYLLMWLLLTFIYIVMPNTKVTFKSALLAGVFAGTAFQLSLWAYVHFQIGVSKYGAIYGSFAAVPLFLMWLQVAWLIVLFGAELSFANQNVGRYESEIEVMNISYAEKRLIALMIVQKLVVNFRDAKPPLTSNEISDELNIPIRVVRAEISDLLESNIIAEIKTDSPKESAYQPAVDIARLDIQYIIQAIEERHSFVLEMNDSDVYNKLKESMKEFGKLAEESPKNMKLHSLDV